VLGNAVESLHMDDSWWIFQLDVDELHDAVSTFRDCTRSADLGRRNSVRIIARSTFFGYSCPAPGDRMLIHEESCSDDAWYRTRCSMRRSGKEGLELEGSSAFP
jgi:hypothetical protein